MQQYDTQIFADQIDYLYLQSRNSYPALFILASFLAIGIHTEVHPLFLAGWYITNLLVLLFRYRLYRAYLHDPHPDGQTRRWYRRFFAGAVITGLVWSAGAFIFFSISSPSHLILLLIIYAGITAGSVIAFSVRIEIFTVYVALYLFPLIYHFSVLDNELATLLTVTVVLYMAYILIASQKYADVSRELMRIKYENADLVTRLSRLNAETEAKLQQTVEDLQRQQTVLHHQAKLASMGEMIGNIAHQWRQPLNVLGLMIQRVQVTFSRGKLDETFVEQFTHDAMHQVEFMSRTIDDFRGFIQPGAQEHCFGVSVAVNDAVRLLTPTFKHHAIRCDVTTPVLPLKVRGNVSDFKQVIVNLLTNARDAFASNGTPEAVLTLSVERVQQQVIIRVQDNGGGIPESVMARIFEPYFTTKEEGKGTGLGLYMSHNIIHDKMNGTLQAANEEDGAALEIRLPLCPDP